MLENDPQKRITFEELRENLINLIPEDLEFSEAYYKKLYQARSSVDKKPLDDQIQYYKDVFQIYKRSRMRERGIEVLNKLIGLIKQKHNGLENEDGEDAIFNLGLSYYSLGVNDKAEKLLKKNFDICIQLYENRGQHPHPHLIRIYENLGALNDNQEKYAEAMELYEKALKYREIILDNDLEKAKLFNSMGMCFYNNFYYKGFK
jgi:tetratricopeptide (TPR) repeat protein